MSDACAGPAGHQPDRPVGCFMIKLMHVIRLRALAATARAVHMQLHAQR
jgi:hypothetical protein